MRNLEEGLKKEKLGIRTRVGEAEQEPSVSCIFHCLPASPGPWQGGSRAVEGVLLSQKQKEGVSQEEYPRCGENGPGMKPLDLEGCMQV